LSAGSFVLALENEIAVVLIRPRRAPDGERRIDPVTRFDTHVALQRVKVGLSLPIEDLGGPL
jgi:hypothetical protein